MDEETTEGIGREALRMLVVGVALGIGAAIAPDIADRARGWLDRLFASAESQLVAFADAVRSQAAIEKQVREGTGPVIWEAMTALEEGRHDRD